MDGLCFEDLDEFGRELDDPLEELVQDVVHGLLETYGSNPDVPTRGVGLRGALSSKATSIPALKAQAESQLRDDDRITNATVNITPTEERGAYRVDILLEVNQTELGIALLFDAAGGVTRIT